MPKTYPVWDDADKIPRPGRRRDHALPVHRQPRDRRRGRGRRDRSRVQRGRRRGDEHPAASGRHRGRRSPQGPARKAAPSQRAPAHADSDQVTAACSQMTPRPGGAWTSSRTSRRRRTVTSPNSRGEGGELQARVMRKRAEGPPPSTPGSSSPYQGQPRHRKATLAAAEPGRPLMRSAIALAAAEQARKVVQVSVAQVGHRAGAAGQ